MWRVGIKVRRDITAAVLRKKARSERDGRIAARLLGIANVLDGMERGAAARAAGMDRQTLCDWVHRYNEEGMEGLRNRPKGRPKRTLTQGQEEEIADMVSQAPPDALARWRCADVKAEIERRFGVVLHESTVGTLLRRLGFRRMSVRPQHPHNDPEAIAAFKKTSPIAWRKSCPNEPQERSSSSGSKTRHG